MIQTGYGFASPLKMLAGTVLVCSLCVVSVGAAAAQDGPELPSVPAFADVPILADTLYFPFEKALLLHLAQEADLARVHVGPLPHRVDPSQLLVAEMEGMAAIAFDALVVEPMALHDEVQSQDDWFVEPEATETAHSAVHVSSGRSASVPRSLASGAELTRSNANHVRQSGATRR